MIDLLKVKLNNTYDYIQALPPEDNSTWLCTVTAGDYVAGYSYKVTGNGNHVTRFDEVNDTLVLANRFEVIETTLEWLNNPFYVERQGEPYRNNTVDYKMSAGENRMYHRYLADASRYTFLDGVVTGVNDDPFIVNDLVQIKGALRNNLFAYVSGESEGSITLEGGDIRNTTENAVIYLVSIPESIEFVLAKMVWWNIYKRQISDVESERIGNYSYKKQQIRNFAYPDDLVGELMPYKQVRFVA